MMHQTHTRVYCMCHRRWILIVKGKYHLKFRTAASLAKCKQNYPVFKAWTNSLYFCLCLHNLKAELLLNCSLTPLNFLLLLLLVSKGRKLWEKFYVIFFWSIWVTLPEFLLWEYIYCIKSCKRLVHNFKLYTTAFWDHLGVLLVLGT